MYKLKKNSIFTEFSFVSIKFLQKVVLIHSLSSFRKPHNSSIFCGFPFWAFSRLIFHIFSIGFISELCWGHFIIAIPSSSRKNNTVLALWQSALSCINISVSTVPLCKWGRACWQWSSLLTLALILLWKQTLRPTPTEEIIPTPLPSNFTVF